MSNRRRLGLRLPVLDDLWIEILVSLPVKSLLRFQCVSKSWKSIISSPTFISTHTQHSERNHNHAHHLLHCSTYKDGGVMQGQFLLFHINDSFSDSEFQKFEYPCQIRGEGFLNVLDCRGLILFASLPLVRKNGLESLVLWNPAIRMSMTLSQPYKFDTTDREYHIYGFGFDHTSNDYKVLRMVLILESRTMRFLSHAELYKLCTGTWETVRLPEDFQYNIVDHKQALVNGASHWVGFHRRDMASHFPKLVVLLFHMCDEEFRVMKLSDCLSSLVTYTAKIGVSGGLLSLIEYSFQGGASIWLMKEYGVVKSWTKQFTLKDGCFWPTLSFWNNEMILVFESRKGCMGLLYDLKTHKLIKNLRTRSNEFNRSLMSLIAKNTFVETLVLLNEVHAIRECDSKKIKEDERKNCGATQRRSKKRKERII